jgi:phenylpropionate dioxygenase-like ring-hydroxylating dioxygenase large terminal subunit
MTDTDLDEGTDQTVDAAPVPTLIARVRALVEGGTTDLADAPLEVPFSYYRDEALAAREHDEVLMTTPMALLPTCRIPEPHDYVVREVLGISVLLTRDADGRARAFLNSCRHRGARPAAGCGSSRRFTCPYHAWTYDSGGTLVGLPGAEGFDGIDRAEHGLVELPSEERHGFLWVVLTAGAPIDLDAHLGPLDAELARWPFAGSEFLTERSLDSTINWKAALEAFAENYHFAYVHGGSIIGQNTVPNTAGFDTFGVHHRLAFPSPWIATTPDDADPLAALSIIYWIYPNLVLGVSVVGTELIDILPTEPGSCRVLHGWMATTPAPDDAALAGYHALYEQVHAAVRDEDFAVLPSCGDGIRHAQHDHMVIGRNEPGVQNVIRAFT